MKETEIEWGKLPFGYVPTDYNVRCTYKDGKWGEIMVSDSDRVDLHMAASCLHYGLINISTRAVGMMKPPAATALTTSTGMKGAAPLPITMSPANEKLNELV